MYMFVPFTHHLLNSLLFKTTMVELCTARGMDAKLWYFHTSWASRPRHTPNTLWMTIIHMNKNVKRALLAITQRWPQIWSRARCESYVFSRVICSYHFIERKIMRSPPRIWPIMQWLQLRMILLALLVLRRTTMLQPITMVRKQRNQKRSNIICWLMMVLSDPGLAQGWRSWLGPLHSCCCCG